MAISIGNNFKKETGYNLKSTSFLNLFNILKEWNNEKFLNIWRTYSINTTNANIKYFETYKLEDNDWWENIAFKYYGNVNLWWVIAMFNNINNPFEEMEPGKSIYILKEQYLYQLLTEMKNISLI